MDLDEADKIRMDYGKFLEITGGKLMKLFLGEIPESLLPYPKDDIEQALGIIVGYFESKGEVEAAKSISSTMSFLMMFVPDEEAIKSASKRFGNPDFVKSYKKNEKSLL